MLVLDRGGCFYYPLKIFERFEWSYLKKMRRRPEEGEHLFQIQVVGMREKYGQGFMDIFCY